MRIKSKKSSKIRKKQAKLKAINATVVKNANNDAQVIDKKTFAQTKITKKGEPKAKKSLGRSFLITVLFVLAFALFFFGVQSLLFYLFNQASIITSGA